MSEHLSGIKSTVGLTTNGGAFYCDKCSERLGDDVRGLSAAIDHYIKKHGYELLHVGTETTHDDKGGPWHCSVAVMGSRSA